MHGNGQIPARWDSQSRGRRSTACEFCTFCEWQVEVWKRALAERQKIAEDKKTIKTAESFHAAVGY